MSKDQNLNTQEKLGEAINNNQLDVLDEIFSRDVVDHDPAPEQGPGPQGFIAMFQTMKTAFPDLTIKPEKLVADEDNVCIAYTMTGTHRGIFTDLPPTGKQFEARGVQIGRFDENGKIVERWGSSDELGILKQLRS